MVKIYRVIQIKLNRITFPYGPCSRAVKMSNVDRVRANTARVRA